MAKATANHFKIWLVVSAAVAGILLVVANSAVWANRYFFNTENFTSTAVPALTSDSSRNALASEIVDRALNDYPLLKSVAASTATNLISGILGSEPAIKVTDRAVGKLQTILTSPQREPIVLNLQGLKDTLDKVLDVASAIDLPNDRQIDVNPDNIPSEIVLFDPSKIPNFYSIGVTLGWLSPLAVIGAIILIAWPYIKRSKEYLQIMLTQGGIILLFGLLALAIGPLFKPTVLANVQSANMRVVVGNVYNAFINTFNTQTLLVIFIGVAAVVVSVGIYAYGYFKKK